MFEKVAPFVVYALITADILFLVYETFLTRHGREHLRQLRHDPEYLPAKHQMLWMMNVIAVMMFELVAIVIPVIVLRTIHPTLEDALYLLAGAVCAFFCAVSCWRKAGWYYRQVYRSGENETKPAQLEREEG